MGIGALNDNALNTIPLNGWVVRVGVDLVLPIAQELFYVLEESTDLSVRMECLLFKVRTQCGTFSPAIAKTFKVLS